MRLFNYTRFKRYQNRVDYSDTPYNNEALLSAQENKEKLLAMSKEGLSAIFTTIVKNCNMVFIEGKEVIALSLNNGKILCIR